MRKQDLIYNKISEKKGQIAILIDPEKSDNESVLLNLLKNASTCGVDYLFIGGSTVTKIEFQNTINFIKANSSIPIIIFPGSSHQISDKSDAILYLSLLSGRNPDYLIGHHIQSANEIIKLDIEIISTGYILIDGGTISSVANVSQTKPIPRDQIEVAKNTAIAGVLQGKKIIYFDAGSGAKQIVPIEIIKEVIFLGIPIIIGGGVKSIEQLEEFKNSGVNVIVIGNHIEENIDFLLKVKEFKKGK